MLGVALAAMLSTHALESWGWRVPFVIGMAMGPVGVYIRRHLDETLSLPASSEVAHAVEASAVARPLREIFGGFAQFFATWLIQLSGNTLAPAWYLIGSCLQAGPASHARS